MRSSKRARPVEAERERIVPVSDDADKREAPRLTSRRFIQKGRLPPHLPYGQHQIVVPAKPWLYLERHTGRKVKLYWMKTSEAWPGDSWLESQFTCFDEEKPDRESDSLWDTYIGNVHQRVLRAYAEVL